MLFALIMLFHSIIYGCSMKEQGKGLLTVQERKITLTKLDGQEYNIVAGADSLYLINLSGCIVSITGARLFNSLFVSDWVVLDAGSGSAPFLGLLRREGMQWTIRDHNTKSIIFLEGLENFVQAEEQRILIVGGYVIGPQRLQVVSARYIDGRK